MRIGIREQLAVVVLLMALVPLAVLAIATWINNHQFVISITSAALTLTASLRAAQIASNLLLIQSTCSTLVTRVLIQQAVKQFHAGNNTDANWSAARADILSALKSGGLSDLLQARVFSRNQTGASNETELLNATATISPGILLPYYNSDGTQVELGDAELGYPPPLYPNITYTITSSPDPMDSRFNLTLVNAYGDYPLNASSALLLGPLHINDTYALLSLTLPIVDNTNPSVVLAFMTIVAAASSLIDIMQSREGLAETGSILLVGPSRRQNRFRYGDRPASATYQPLMGNLTRAPVHYVFPPHPPPNQPDRHSVYNRNLTEFGSSNFTEGAYPAILAGFGTQNAAINNASSLLDTHNENNVSVAVGYARPQSSLVQWLLVVEQSHDEAWAPIVRLRKIVLACVFATIGAVLIVVVPLAHYSVRPIRRLRDATEKSVAPPGYTPNGSTHSVDEYGGAEVEDEENNVSPSQASKKSVSGARVWVRMRRMGRRGRRKSKEEVMEENRRRVFKVPGKVLDRKHFITDELTELTTTFNEMSDELMLQYSSLEEKVAERTQELEISKKAAEAANESKTLFIANISHELKTPLNGILGMCAVCMGEDDLPRIKRSLQVVYKSGDLLLHLLNDLLTFSKNQIGQQLSLEEKEFRLADIKSQIITIFDKQVREGRISFGVKFIGSDAQQSEAIDEKVLPALGPQGIGRLKDLCLYGDQHRILQIIINLVSNSLKFTPEGGKVEVRIKCLGEKELSMDESRDSLGSKNSQRPLRLRGRQNDSGSNTSQISRKPSSSTDKNSKPAGTALLINPMDPKATPKVQVRERSPTPPPANAKTLIFEIEVEDTGPGIPEHLQEQVFEPFVQADLGLSKKYGGTGLGLSICSQLAGIMGGRISLTSTVGVGSTFQVLLPLKHVRSRALSTSSSDLHPSRPPSLYNHSAPDLPQNGTERIPGDMSPRAGPFNKDTQPRLVGLSQPFFAAAPSISPSTDSAEQIAILGRVAANKEGTGKLRVLVAEDNLVNQEVVLRMLKLEDVYDVVVAKDGQEAYDMVKESMDQGHFFNLIFMDIQMPNLDGLQSTRLIRQMGYNAPIVALTAFNEESNVKDCYDSGMNMFLSKPIRRPALKQVLKKFATIPEEAETSSVAEKSTPSDTDSPLITGKSAFPPSTILLPNGTNSSPP